MAGGSFLAMLRISGFLGAVWSMGKVSKMIGISSIVLEILCGIVLAPGLLPADLMPSPYAECRHQTYSVFGKHYDLLDEVENGGMCNDAAVSAYIDGSQPSLVTMMHHLAEVDKDGLSPCHDEEGAYRSVFYSETVVRRWAHAPKLVGALSRDNEAAELSEVELADLDAELAQLENRRVDYKSCVKSECEKEVSHLCQIEPNIFTLIGHTGVAMMIFESGMHFDFDKAREVGPWACVVAVLGTLLPLLAGMGLTAAFGYDIYPDGFAVGVALAPTSVGIALKLLMEAKCLQKNFGQLIMTAAFVDDILSLIIFNVLFSITQGDFDPVVVVVYPIVGIVFMLVGGGMGISFWPNRIRDMNRLIPAKKTPGSLSSQDEAILVLLFGLLIGYGTFTFMLGTHLWGCFIAGMSFAGVHHVHHVWVKQVKRITTWMLRIFFSCTVAFAIPINSLLTVEAFCYGSIMGIVACVGTKVFCAPFMGRPRFVIGWAMVGRAEFAYLIAEMAKSSKIMSDEVFAIVIWALLYATILAPFAFRYVLGNYAKEIEAQEAAAAKENLGEGKEALKCLTSVDTDPLRCSNDGVAWQILTDQQSTRLLIFYPKGSRGLEAEERLTELWGIFSEHQMRIVKVEIQSDADGGYFETFKIQPKVGETCLPDQLQFIQEELHKRLTGTGAHVLWFPAGGSIGGSCKVAKLEVTVDMHETHGSVDGIFSIVKKCSAARFFCVRSSVQLYGQTAVIELLIANAKAMQVDPRSPTASPKASPRGAPQATAEQLWRKSSQQNLNFLTYATENTMGGTGDVPEITNEDLMQLKSDIEGSVSGCRVWCLTEPMVNTIGPIGMEQHSAELLLQAQHAKHTAEIKFRLDRMYCDLAPRIIDRIAKHNLTIVSARVDERAACQVNIVVSSDLLSEEVQSKLMDGLKLELERVDTPNEPPSGLIIMSGRDGKRIMSRDVSKGTDAGIDFLPKDADAYPVMLGKANPENTDKKPAEKPPQEEV